MFFKKISELVKYKGDQLAIKDSSGEYTYKALWQEVCRIRQLAYHKGVTGETVIIIGLDNSCKWIICFLALCSLGAKLVPISPDSPGGYLNHIKKELKVDIIINQRTYSEFFNSNLNSKEYDDIPFPDEDEEIVYHITSGSTGKVKYCVRTLGQFYHEGLMYQDALKMCSEDIIVCPLPLYHSFAFGFTFIAGLSVGAGIVVLKEFIPRKYLNILISEKASLSLLVPVMAHLLSKTFLPYEVDLSFLRYLVVGAGSISESVFKSFKNKYQIELASNYGSSETGGIITRTDSDTYPSIGSPMVGVTVQIRGANNEIKSVYEEGEVWVKSPSMLNRYYKKSDIFDKYGFYYMGDIGYKDNKNNIFFVGREKNLVNIGGKKVNTIYIEKILQSYQYIKECLVIGWKRTYGEELLVAVIAANEDLNKDKLNLYMKEKLESYMIPSVIHFVDNIPRNKLGKVEREGILNLINTKD